ncbi:hypothetical protein, partial [Anaerotruncus colihominis]|uniref:hypothetical protein n=1 Tax=Anaerotruncus colihominis TaxID=169435 RepID=UPI0034A34C66
QKTLVGCAANRRIGASQTKVFARLFQKAAGEKKGKAPRGSCLFSRAAPLSWAAALIKARPAGRKTPIQKRGLSPAGEVTDAARLARILQAPTV